MQLLQFQFRLIVQEPVFLIQKLKLLVFVLDLKMVEKNLYLLVQQFVLVLVTDLVKLLAVQVVQYFVV